MSGFNKFPGNENFENFIDGILDALPAQEQMVNAGISSEISLTQLHAPRNPLTSEISGTFQIVSDEPIGLDDLAKGTVALRHIEPIVEEDRRRILTALTLSITESDAPRAGFNEKSRKAQGLPASSSNIQAIEKVNRGTNVLKNAGDPSKVNSQPSVPPAKKPGIKKPEKPFKKLPTWDREHNAPSRRRESDSAKERAADITGACAGPPKL